MRCISVFVAATAIVTVAGCGGSTPAPPVALTFTSPASATLTASSWADFHVMVTDPAATITESGRLPHGLPFHPGTGGRADLVGTPAAQTGGKYAVHLTAVDGTRRVMQTLTLTVDETPAFSSADSTSIAAIAAISNTQVPILTSGYPLPKLTETGNLPSGLSFTAFPNGSGMISGAPQLIANPCNGQITLIATNSLGQQKLTVSVSIENLNCLCNLICGAIAKNAPQIGKAIYNGGKYVGQQIIKGGKVVGQTIVKNGQVVGEESEQLAEEEAASGGE